jgi:hypothetical protein
MARMFAADVGYWSLFPCRSGPAIPVRAGREEAANSGGLTCYFRHIVGLEVEHLKHSKWLAREGSVPDAA